VKLPLSAVALSAGYGTAESISRTLTGITALPTKVRAEYSLQRDIAGPLAIAQQSPRDFLTAKRASVSVKGYGVPSYFVARGARTTP
jgi:hypothetical protein